MTCTYTIVVSCCVFVFSVFFMEFAIYFLLSLLISGCGSQPPQVVTKKTPSARSTTGDLLSKLMLENIGTRGTIEQDYENAMTYNEKFDGSTARLLKSSYDDIYVKTRQTWSTAPQEYVSAPKMSTAKPLPIPLIKFLLFVRLVGNLLHANKSCLADEITAANMFSIDSFPSTAYYGIHKAAYFEPLRTCLAINTDIRDCYSIALTISQAALLSQLFENAYRRKMRPAKILHLFPSILLEMDIVYRKCPSDSNRLKLTQYFDQMTTLMSTMLEPSANDCLAEHYAIVMKQLSDLDSQIRPVIETC